MTKRSALKEFLSADAASESIVDLKAQVRALERRVRRAQTKEATIVEAVQGALAAAPPVLRAPPTPRPGRGRYDEVAILHLSDTQIGKITKSYDTTVAEERVLLAVEKAAYIADLRRKIARVDEMHVYLGGDMIEGEDIFPHQAHEIDSSLFDQACVNAPRIFSRAILAALASFPRVKVFCVAGNHGRNGPKSTRANPLTNWDRVTYQVLRATLLGTREAPRKELASRLTFTAPEDFYVVDRVFDWGHLLVHGHQVSGGFGGFPWYGVGKKAWGWIDVIEEPWDAMFMGHFHTPAMMTLGYRRVYANGTTESDNDFAKEQLAAAGEPCQRLVFTDAKHGVVSDTLLYLGARKPNSKR